MTIARNFFRIIDLLQFVTIFVVENDNLIDFDKHDFDIKNCLSNLSRLLLMSNS